MKCQKHTMRYNLRKKIRLKRLIDIADHKFKKITNDLFLTTLHQVTLI